MSITVSDFLVERLHAWGVRRIFGYPGDGINGVFGAMLVIGVLALGAEGLMSVVETRLLAWKPKSASESNVQGL